MYDATVIGAPRGAHALEHEPGVRRVSLSRCRPTEHSAGWRYDVREDDQWPGGHAPAAVHLPLSQISASTRLNEQTLLTVCRSGSRSARAAKVLADGGNAVRNVAGGKSAWAAARLLIARDGDAAGSVI